MKELLNILQENDYYFPSAGQPSLYTNLSTVGGKAKKTFAHFLTLSLASVGLFEKRISGFGAPLITVENAA